MTRTRSFIYWLITFLAFPLGGFVAFHIVGSVTNPAKALLAGALAGLIIGTAQWLVVKSRGVDFRWVILTGLGMAVGSAAAAFITDAGTTVGELVITGLVSGATVGAVQGIMLGGSFGRAAAWACTTSAAWGIGWLITANVIVDADRGYVTFGSSGALVATILTGLVLTQVMPVQPKPSDATTPNEQPTAEGQQ